MAKVTLGFDLGIMLATLALGIALAWPLELIVLFASQVVVASLLGWFVFCESFFGKS